MNNNTFYTDEVLHYAAEIFIKFGYRKVGFGYSSKERLIDYVLADYSKDPENYSEVKDEMLKVRFNPFSVDADHLVKDAMNWLNSQSASEEYIANLQQICNEPETDTRKFGFIASLFQSYSKSLERERKDKELDADRMTSQFLGQVGKPIEVEVSSFKFVKSYEGVYGTTFIYEIRDNNNNICIWRTGKDIDDDVHVDYVKGTVKSHTEFRGVKQTELTRCKLY